MVELSEWGPARGESDVRIQVQMGGKDEEVEYAESNGTVRYVASWMDNEDEEYREAEETKHIPLFEQPSFEDWNEAQCLLTVGRAAADHVNNELDTDEVNGEMRVAENGNRTAAVSMVSTLFDQNGNVVEEADIEFETLVATTPASFKATYLLDTQKHEIEGPIYAISAEGQWL